MVTTNRRHARFPAKRPGKATASGRQRHEIHLARRPFGRPCADIDLGHGRGLSGAEAGAARSPKDFKFHTGDTMPELRLHYTTVGEPTGQPVLVLHGTGGSGAACALCAWPASCRRRALDDISLTPRLGNSWCYHGPRLASRLVTAWGMVQL